MYVILHYVPYLTPAGGVNNGCMTGGMPSYYI